MSLRSLIVGLAVLVLAAAGCGDVAIPSGKLACGKNATCPPGFTCGAGNLCVRPDAGTKSDAGGGDTHGPETGGSDALSPETGGGSDGPAADAPTTTADGGGSACPALDTPTGGSVMTTSLTVGSTATYSCNAGSSLSGAATRSCQGDGSWSGTAPTCSLVDCGSLMPPTNGSVSAPKTTYQSVATYSCAAGFGPSGSSTRTCQSDGKWDGAMPMCVVANCPALPGPMNGSVSAPMLTHGSTATYSCNAGFTLSGAMTSMCQSNDMWSGTPPTCTAKDCGAPGMPANGSVSAPMTTFQSVAMYMCGSGYTLSGSTTRTCQSDQSWSGTVPTCVPVDCGVLGVANGSVSYATTTYGSMAMYSCSTNFMLSGGGPTVTCQANAHWSATPTCVDICTGAGAHGTATHCCDSTACPATAPVCNTNTHACAQKNLGDGCSSAGQCASGFCAFGVCCSEACPGNSGCNTACTGGTCTHAGSHVGCGTRPLGQAGLNDISLICDGKGNCVGPTVPCGISHIACDLTVKACCQDYPSSSFSVDCVPPAQCCDGTAATCGGGTDQRWYACKSDLDCPMGKTCCADVNWLGNYGFQYAECKTSCTDPFNVHTCDVNRPVTAQCPNPQTCNMSTDDYAVCY
jgi:hypothetical protein